MDARGLLAREEFDFDPETVEIEDEATLDLLEPAVREWWAEQFGAFVPENGGFFTPPQREAIPLIHGHDNALIASPTGSGKTLASFTAILNELFRREQETGLENSVYCLYVSPLKSLANDIHRNLELPLSGIRERMDDVSEVRHAIRHGDTDKTARQKMLKETPHILNTTPETLAILLNSPKFRDKLRSVEYVIVDEIHSLADGKRGTHLSVSLERLETIADVLADENRVFRDGRTALGHRGVPRRQGGTRRGESPATKSWTRDSSGSSTSNCCVRPTTSFTRRGPSCRSGFTTNCTT